MNSHFPFHSPQVNRHNKAEDRIIVLTENTIFKLNHSFKEMKAIPLTKVMSKTVVHLVKNWEFHDPRATYIPSVNSDRPFKV